jgi:hypothetical protein
MCPEEIAEALIFIEERFLFKYNEMDIEFFMVMREEDLNCYAT